MATVTRGTFTNNYLPGLYAKGIAEYTAATKMYRELSRGVKAKRAWVEITKDPSIGVIPSKVEGSPMTKLSLSQGYLKRLTAVTYAAYLRFTEEAIEDDMYDELMKYPGLLGASAAETKEVNFFNTVFNNAFATTTTADGANVYSNSHAHAASGQAYDNLDTGAALAAASLWSSINVLRSLVDGGGKKINISPDILLIPPVLEQTARELLESTHYPEDDRNAINAVRHFKLKLRVSKYLSSSTAFFLLGAKKDRSIWHWDRTPVQFRKDGDFVTTDSKFGVRFRYTDGVYDGMGIVGNAGA